MSESDSEKNHNELPNETTMTATAQKTNRQYVEEALVNLLEGDKHNNSYRYFRAASLANSNPALSAAIVGSYLPKIEKDSPLDNGIIVERHTDSRCSATLWIVREEK